MARYVVVRSPQSGVWFGRFVKREGDAVTLRLARRAWSWQGALSCSELAVRGPAKKGSRICIEVPRAVIFGACEVLDATEMACKAWAEAPEVGT